MILKYNQPHIGNIMSFNRRKSIYSTANIKAQQRARDAFCMAAKGYTIQEIADELGITYSGVQGCLRRAYKKFTEESNLEMKNTILAAMQEKLRQCEDLLKSRDTKIKLMAMEQFRKYLADMRKMCGLDQPERTDITSGGEPINFNGKEWESL